MVKRFDCSFGCCQSRLICIFAIIAPVAVRIPHFFNELNIVDSLHLKSYTFKIFIRHQSWFFAHISYSYIRVFFDGRKYSIYPVGLFRMFFGRFMEQSIRMMKNNYIFLILQRQSFKLSCDLFHQDNQTQLRFQLINQSHNITCIRIHQTKMMSELESLMKCIDDVDKNLDIEQIPDRVLLLMGETKAGKTTLMYYLLKKKLLLVQNADRGITVMKADAIFHDYVIGDNYESATVYPNIPPEIDDGCMIIDMPGFNDTRLMYRLLNIYIIRRTIQKIKNVHVSFVIPFESLQGDNLYNSLHNSCQLLNPEFLKAIKCSSFILTKVQNKEEDKQNFEEHLQYFQQEYAQDVIGSFAANLQETNIYQFCRQNPVIEEGGQLKNRIINQNKFYQINENPDKLLSENYTETMIGKGNSQEFIEFSKCIINDLQSFLPLIVQLLSELLTYHYGDLLKECLQWDETKIENVEDSIKQKLGRLKVCNLNKLDFDPEEIELNREEEIVQFMKNVQIYFKVNKQDVITEKLNILINISQIILGGTDKINKQLKKKVYYVLKNSVKVLNTLYQIKFSDLSASLQKIQSLAQLKNAIDSFDKVLGKEVVLSILGKSEAQQLLSKDDHFRDFVAQHFPEVTDSNQVKIVQVRCHDKIKKQKWSESIKSSLNKQQIYEEMVINVDTLIPKKQSQIKTFHKKLKQISSNEANLKNLLKTLRQYESKEKNISNIELNYKIAIWKRTVKMLSDLRLYQEAILTSLALPDLIRAEIIIDQGIRFKEISSDFIQTILVPFYSQVQFNFTITQKLFNALIENSLTLSDIRKYNNQYSSTIQNMRKIIQETNGQSQYATKRFDIHFIEAFTDGQGLKDVIERAKNHRKALQGSQLAKRSVQQKLSELSELS